MSTQTEERVDLREPETPAPRAGGRHRAATTKRRKQTTRVTVSLTKRPAPTTKRRRLLRTIALLLLVVATIGAAVTAFLLQRANSRSEQVRSVENARVQAVAAARSYLPDILGYDYRHLSADIAKAKSEGTGQFLSDYTSTAAKVLVSAPSIKAIVSATVSGSAVVNAQPDRVTLLMYVDQQSVKQLQGQKTPTTRIDPYRVQLTVSKVHGRWLVSALEPV